MPQREFLLTSSIILFTCATTYGADSLATAHGTVVAGSPATSRPAVAPAIRFVDGSATTLLLQHNGREYVVDLAARTVTESQATGTADRPQATGPTKTQVTGSSPPRSPEPAAVFRQNCSRCHGPDGRGLPGVGTPDFGNPKVQAGVTDEQIVSTIKNGKKGTPMPAWSGKLASAEILAAAAYVRSLAASNVAEQPAAAQPSGAEPSTFYRPGDDVLFTLPTGRPLERHSLDINFTHRFVFDPAFTGPARGGDLFGLDGVGLASFGFAYGITNRFFAEVYRSPTFIGRPIQLLTGYRLLDERHGHPLNAVVRVSMEGRNDFSREFSESFEVIASRSLGSRAQVYFVPAVTLNNHRLVQPNGVRSRDIPATPRVNSFALGIGASLDVRPTVAIVAEVTPTVVGQDELGVDHPAFSFGVQKKIFRHAFTLGFTNTPGTTVPDRSQTRAAYLGAPGSDGASGLFIGFDLTRQLH